MLCCEKNRAEGGLGAEKINELSKDDAENFIKRKNGLMKKIRKLNVGSSQEKMEKYLMAYIKDLRKNNQWVTILIIFQKVFELSPLLKVGKMCQILWS